MADPKRRAGAASAKQARPQTQYLVFHVSGVELGLALACISEIVPYERVTHLPGAPAFARGVVHLRGRMVAVMDTAVRLGLSPELPSKRTCIVMVDPPAQSVASFGLVVDRVATLLDVHLDTIQPAPDFGVGLDVRYLEGLCYQDERVLPLLSVRSLFTEREVLATVGSAADAHILGERP
jgi:purine-binding chemotaxis protein CheW